MLGEAGRPPPPGPAPGIRAPAGAGEAAGTGESRREEFAAAVAAPEAHRPEYLALTADAAVALRRAERLFAEAPFADLGFRAADLPRQPDKTAALETFLATHPELAAAMQADCRAAEVAAAKLLARDDARALRLSPEEGHPWLAVRQQRLLAAPEGLGSYSPARPPDQAAIRAFMNVGRGVAAEMVVPSFTPPRLAALQARLHERHRRFAAEETAAAARRGVPGALVALTSAVSPDHRFLTLVCFASRCQALAGWAAATKTGAT